MYHPFTIAETLQAAWDVLKKNFSTIAIYALISFSVIGIAGFIVYSLLTDNFSIGVGLFFLLVIFSLTFLGFIKLLLQLMDKEYYEFDFKDIVPTIKMLYSYLLLLIIVTTPFFFFGLYIKGLDEGLTKYWLGIVVGGVFQFFCLFYFPMCSCFIVDDSSGPFESVVQSFKLIQGNFLKYFLLLLIIEFIAFIGSIIVIGIFFVIPCVNLLLVVAYRRLIYSHQDIDDVIAETN